MPFTLAHIGYILPVKKKWKTSFSTTGLVFGSLAPDYDILFRITNVRFHLFQYDLIEILLYILPLSMLSAFFFHLFCRNILIEHLPEPFEKRYSQHNAVNTFHLFRTSILRIGGSALFAIFLHLLLDFLCHMLDAHSLKMAVFSLFQNEFMASSAYFLGIYGLPVLFSLAGFYLIFRYEFPKPVSVHSFKLTKNKLQFWSLFLISTLLIAAIKIKITETDLEFYADYIIISLTTSLMLAIYFTCLIYAARGFFLKKINR